MIYAPGGKTWAVGWVKHLNMSLGCDSNGIDWESGNSLRVTDSVIQGYPQYAIRAGVAYGGYQGLTTENVYGEIGGCKNPVGNIGEAGLAIAELLAARLQVALERRGDGARRIELTLCRESEDEWFGFHYDNNSGYCRRHQF